MRGRGARSTGRDRVAARGDACRSGRGRRGRPWEQALAVASGFGGRRPCTSLAQRLAGQIAPAGRAGVFTAAIATLAAVCAPAPGSSREPLAVSRSMPREGSSRSLLARVTARADGVCGLGEHVVELRQGLAAWRLWRGVVHARSGALGTSRSSAHARSRRACALPRSAPGRRIAAARAVANGRACPRRVPARGARARCSCPGGSRSPRPAAPLGDALVDGWAGERGASPPGSPGVFVRTGDSVRCSSALAVAGVVLAALRRSGRARPLGAGLLAIVVIGALGAGVAGAPRSDPRGSARRCSRRRQRRARSRRRLDVEPSCAWWPTRSCRWRVRGVGDGGAPGCLRSPWTRRTRRSCAAAAALERRDARCGTILAWGELPPRADRDRVTDPRLWQAVVGVARHRLAAGRHHRRSRAPSARPVGVAQVLARRTPSSSRSGGTSS